MSRSRLWLLPLLLAVLVGGAWYFDAQAKKGDRELDVYVRGGQRMAAGEEIYRRGTEDKPFTYPPFAAVPFVPFAMMPESWHAEAWFVVNFLILLGMLRFLHRYATSADTGRGPPKLWWFWIPTAVFGGRHVVSMFTNQSNDLLVAGLVCLTAVCWSRRHQAVSMWAGLFAGLGAAMKATPLIFLGLFGLRLHWLAMLALLLGVAGATLLPDMIWPRAVAEAADLDPERLGAGTWWRAWYDHNLAGLEVGGTAEASGAWNSHSVLNQSLSGATRRLFTPVEVADGSFVVGDAGYTLLYELSPGMAKVATLGLSGLVLGLIALCVWFARRVVRLALEHGEHAAAVAQRRVALGEIGAFACGMVLLSPQSSKAHFCVWLFPVAFVINHLTRNGRDIFGWLMFAAALVLGLLSKGLLGRENANVVLAYGSVAWSTFLLLLTTLHCLCRAAPEAERTVD